MQELIEAWYSPDKIDNFDAWLGNNETRLLEKEKEQIEEAYSQGYGDGVQEPNPNDEYYKQTYKQLK